MIKISIVVPTYNEADNVEALISGVFGLGLDLELIIVDDASPDGTGKIADRLCGKYPNLRVIHRSERGLASAVVEGFKAAEGRILGVMDADFSHPLDAVPRVIAPIAEGSADVAIGSRYIPGGEIQGWNLVRKITSRGAVLLARPLTPVKDPVSGFIFLNRAVLDGATLSPAGYKIGLEILVKGRYRRAVEIPYTFKNRDTGKSKLNIREYWNYIIHLTRLYRYRLTRLFR
ncbi:MAG: polyprenol monophosphomannose synthase [Candidatus Hydrothermarchaeales archaeon]